MNDNHLKIEAEIEKALRAESMSVEQLAKALNVPVPVVNDALAKMIADKQVFNLSLASSPVYTWCIGDKTPTLELRATIIRLITERPMTTKELVVATGARMSRVGGCVVEIQRANASCLRNLSGVGDGHLARWFYIPEKGPDDPEKK